MINNIAPPTQLQQPVPVSSETPPSTFNNVSAPPNNCNNVKPIQLLQPAPVQTKNTDDLQVPGYQAQFNQPPIQQPLAPPPAANYTISVTQSAPPTPVGDNMQPVSAFSDTLYCVLDAIYIFGVLQNNHRGSQMSF